MAGLFFLLSVIAAVAAVAIIFMVFNQLNQSIAIAQRGAETTAVVIAKRTLPQGHPIRREDLIWQEVPPDYVPDAVFTDVMEVANLVPRERILPGEMIRKERLATPDAGEGLNAIIPMGYRALQLNVTAASAVSGFINPGNYVDIIVTYREVPEDPLSEEEPDFATITMLEVVEVLAVGQRLSAEDDAEDGGGVTFRVKTSQAQRITQANIVGNVTLTLRNDIDVTRKETHGARSLTLIGKPEGQKSIADLRQLYIEKKMEAMKGMAASSASCQEVLVIEGQTVRRVYYDEKQNRVGPNCQPLLGAP